jgi:hypothetical protein
MSEPITYVERTGVRKDGKPMIRTHRHHWAICDVCGEGCWILSSRLTKTKDDSQPGLRCRMTPRCKGKHRKDDDG